MENGEFKTAIQVTRRQYKSYIDIDLKKGLYEPASKWKKFCQSDGGCEPIALDVSMALSTYSNYTEGVFNSVPRNKICCKISTLYSSSSTSTCSCFTVHCLIFTVYCLWRFHHFIYLLGSASFIWVSWHSRQFESKISCENCLCQS